MNLAAVRIVMHGRPVAKGRPRAFLIPGTKKIGHYTPSKTRTWEGMFRVAAMDVMKRRAPFDCPVHVEVTATFSVPKSWPEWKRELALAGRVLQTGTPDGGNILKAAEDSMNGVVYRDDSLISVTTCTKTYGQRDSVVAVVTPLQAYPSSIKKRPDGI